MEQMQTFIEKNFAMNKEVFSELQAKLLEDPNKNDEFIFSCKLPNGDIAVIVLESFLPSNLLHEDSEDQRDILWEYLIDEVSHILVFREMRYDEDTIISTAKALQYENPTCLFVSDGTEINMLSGKKTKRGMEEIDNLFQAQLELAG